MEGYLARSVVVVVKERLFQDGQSILLWLAAVGARAVWVASVLHLRIGLAVPVVENDLGGFLVGGLFKIFGHPCDFLSSYAIHVCQ